MQSSNRPHRFPTSLSSLPIEVIHLVLSHTDQPTAAALARTSKLFNTASEIYIWRELHINCRGDIAERDSHAEADRQDAGVKERVEGMMDAGNRRRWSMVRRAVIDPVPSALHGAIQILSNIAPYLQSLTIAVASLRVDDWPCPDGLDTRFQSCRLDLSFPSLTHVRIGRYATVYVEFLTVLCESAPYLVFLDAEVGDGKQISLESDRYETEWCPFPYRLSRNTRLRRLHISYDDVGIDGGEHDPFAAIADLLHRSPGLVELSIMYDLPESFPVQVVTPLVSRMKGLEELEWPVSEMEGWEGGQDGQGVFPALRRLLLASARSVFPSDLPPFPSLEILSTDHTRRSEDSEQFTPFPDYDDIQEHMPGFFTWLREHPHVRIAHSVYDQSTTRMITNHDDTTGNQTGHVRSVLHRGQEMIQVSLLFQDMNCRGSREYWLHLASNGEDLPEHGRRVGEPKWERFTELNGVAVPAEVWDEMLAVEGLKESEGMGRGVAVGEAGWKVVVDWQKGLEE